MTKERFDEIVSAVKNRCQWETKQVNWYNARHTGVKRGGKPYPGAPDMHFPLADSMIEKLKAFYVQLIYAKDTLADFVSKKAGQMAETTTAVASWFDYQLKQQSNFEREVMIAIDQMLQNQMELVKVRWDADCKRLAFDARDPMYVIVPKGTQEIKDADWLIDVIPMSEAQYRANPEFEQGDDFVKSIKGSGTESEQTGIQNKEQIKEMREGIGYSKDENTIIVWECYMRDRINKRIMVETLSPLLGWQGERIRKDFTLPYNKGLFKSGERFPFMKFRTEIKDKGFYSERSIPEVVFQFEQWLNKTWNTQCTWMDYFAQPMFKQTQSGIAGTHNFRSKPGASAPFGLEPIDPPAAPSSLQEQMQFGRALAEYRVSIPDLGAGQHLTPYSQGEGKKTAHEVSALMDISGMSNDVRSRVFRLDFGELLNLAWSILLQYAETELSYVLQGEMQTLDQGVLHEDYEIRPNGSSDSWNKAGQLQKAMARFQQFNQDPYIDQGELRKSVLELDDPSLIKRLFRDPGESSKEQAEQQAVECVLMLFGWPAETNMADDDKTHLLTLGHFVEDKIQRQLMTPELARLSLQHGSKHMDQLHQKKDPALKQIEGQLMPIVQILGQIAQQPDQAPTNVLQMSQAQGTQTPAQSAAPSGPAQSSNADPVGDATKVGNMLVNMAKAGVPVAIADFNQVLTGLHLPPITIAPQAIPQQQPQTATQ